MIPKGSEAILGLAAHVARDLAAGAPDAYAAADLTYTAMLMGLIAQDYDRAVEVLAEEHAALQPVLREAGSRLGDPALKRRIEAALAAEAPSQRVSDLTARSDADLRLLIDIQAAVEEADAAGAEWARRLDGEIWRFLEAHVAGRAYDAGF